MKKPDEYEVPLLRLQLIRESIVSAPAIKNARDVANLLQDVALSDREQTVALYLDTKHHPVGRHVVSVGTLNTCLVHPRETLKCALLANAHGFILAHNHPSGDVNPSEDDDAITQAIAKAAHLIRIPLIDHVILSPTGDLYSYEQQNPYCLHGGF